MRSKEVEEYIDYLKTRLSLLHNNYQYATEQAIEGVLAYIEELEKLPNKIRDKIKELDEDTDVECIEFNLDVIEILKSLLGE